MFSWFDSYDIYYENGSVAYTVKGQLSWGHLLNIYDPSGNKLGYIKEKIVSLLPRFNVYIAENHLGTITREFTFFKPRYSIDFNGWDIKGDFLGWNYQAYSGTELVMSATKKIWNLTDTYEIDVYSPANELYSLMIVLAIDAANCSKND